MILVFHIAVRNLLVCNAVNDSDSLSLSSARKQVFGRFEEVEEEEPCAEEAQGQGSHGVDEVSPAEFHRVVDDEDPSDCLKSSQNKQAGEGEGNTY
jgi:hypothetical protein